MSHGTSIALCAVVALFCATMLRRTVRGMFFHSYEMELSGGFVALVVVEFVGLGFALLALGSLI